MSIYRHLLPNLLDSLAHFCRSLVTPTTSFHVIHWAIDAMATGKSLSYMSISPFILFKTKQGIISYALQPFNARYCKHMIFNLFFIRGSQTNEHIAKFRNIYTYLPPALKKNWCFAQPWISLVECHWDPLHQHKLASKCNWMPLLSEIYSTVLLSTNLSCKALYYT